LKQRGSERIGWGRGRVTDHCADALAWLEQAPQFQGANGIPGGAAAHSQHPNQFPFGRQKIARLQFFRNEPVQVLGNLLIDLISISGEYLELRGCFSDWHGGWSDD